MNSLTCLCRTIFFGFVFLFANIAIAGKYNSVLNIGDQMPEFNKLPTTEGATVSSSDLKESVVVFVSLANHCPWVKGLDAGLVDLANKFQGKDVKVVGFSVNDREDDRLPAMKVHAKKFGYNFTYAFDESQDIGRKLGATRTPEYFVFDKNRKLAYMGLLHDSPARMTSDGKVKHINGEPKEFYVENAITALLAGKPIDVKETRAHGCGVKYKKHEA